MSLSAGTRHACGEVADLRSHQFRACKALLPLQALLLLVALVPASLAAQSTGTTTGDLKGRVTDEKGLTLPGARLTAIHRETGVSRSVLSDSSGAYELPLLPPGLYRVRVELPDAVPVVVDSVRVTIGTTTPLDVVVRPPRMAEAEVVVGAVSPLIDPQKTDVATTVDTAKIQYLPSIQRNYLSFSLLRAGTGSAPSPSGSSEETISRSAIRPAPGSRFAPPPRPLADVPAWRIRMSQARFPSWASWSFSADCGRTGETAAMLRSSMPDCRPIRM